MAQNNAATDEPHGDRTKERDAVRDAAREYGLYSLVFYGSEPWIALVDRDKSPSTSHALPNETIAVVEWASDKLGYVQEGWAVSITTASERQTNPEWEVPGEPDEMFASRQEAVEWAAEQL